MIKLDFSKMLVATYLNWRRIQNACCAYRTEARCQLVLKALDTQLSPREHSPETLLKTSEDS